MWQNKTSKQARKAEQRKQRKKGKRRKRKSKGPDAVVFQQVFGVAHFEHLQRHSSSSRKNIFHHPTFQVGSTEKSEKQDSQPTSRNPDSMLFNCSSMPSQKKKLTRSRT